MLDDIPLAPLQPEWTADQVAEFEKAHDDEL